MACLPLDVLLLGHSYITRLDRHCTNHNMKNLKLDKKSHRINFFGSGGKYVSQLQNDIRHIRRIKPDLICIVSVYIQEK